MTASRETGASKCFHFQRKSGYCCRCRGRGRRRGKRSIRSGGGGRWTSRLLPAWMLIVSRFTCTIPRNSQCPAHLGTWIVEDRVRSYQCEIGCDETGEEADIAAEVVFCAAIRSPSWDGHPRAARRTRNLQSRPPLEVVSESLASRALPPSWQFMHDRWTYGSKSRS